MSAGQCIENISGVLIAGGKSRRMGRDKRFLAVGGTNVFQRTLDLLKQTFSETIVVLAEPIDSLEMRGCRVVYDLIPDTGSLGGLYTGLMASSQSRIFAVACDMPFLNSDTIRFMASFDATADIIVAELEGRFQPMHALYSQRCIPLLKVMAEERDLTIRKLYSTEGLRVVVLRGIDLAMIQAGTRSFQNVNTLDDLTRAEAEIAGQS